MNLVKFALPAVLSLCLAGTIHAESATDFGPKTKIGRVGGLAKLPSHLQNLYRQFRREANYFAAMAVNFETGDGFYIRNFHDAARARAAAIEGCRQFTGSDGCVLYAVAIPNSLPFDQLDASGLSMLAAKEFNTAYVKRRKPGTFAAFAISGASHHGYGDAYDTAEDAKDSAIAYCNIYVAKDMAEMGRKPVNTHGHATGRNAKSSMLRLHLQNRITLCFLMRLAARPRKEVPSR